MTVTTPPAQRYLSIGTAARLVGRSPTTLRELEARGLIPAPALPSEARRAILHRLFRERLLRPRPDLAQAQPASAASAPPAPTPTGRAGDSAHTAASEAGQPG